MRCPAIAVGLLFALACGGEGEGSFESAAPTEEVAATVDGRPIDRAELLAEIEAAGVTPREALDALEERAFLEAEAERLGLGLEGRLGPETERAAVRQLLDAIEEEHSPASMPAEDVRAAWEERIEGRPLPERRDFEDMEAELREELANRARFQALAELIQRLEEEVGVERDEAALGGLADLPIRFEEGP